MVTKININHYQGDISLIVCEQIKGKVIKHSGEYILALGETTGHAHKIKVAEPSQMVVIKDEAGNLFLHLLGEGTLTHEEHGTHKVSPGWYKLGHEREHSYFENETRRVID